MKGFVFASAVRRLVFATPLPAQHAGSRKVAPRLFFTFNASAYLCTANNAHALSLLACLLFATHICPTSVCSMRYTPLAVPTRRSCKQRVTTAQMREMRRRLRSGPGFAGAAFPCAYTSKYTDNSQRRRVTWRIFTLDDSRSPYPTPTPSHPPLHSCRVRRGTCW